MITYLADVNSATRPAENSPGRMRAADVDMAKQRMLNAQDALERYIRRGMVDLEQHKRLSDSLRLAIDELIDRVSEEFAS